MYTYTQNIDALIFLSLSHTARIRFHIIATELLNRIKANWGGGGGGGEEEGGKGGQFPSRHMTSY